MRLFADIETACPEWDEPRRAAYVRSCVPKTHRLPDTIDKWCKENAESAWSSIATDYDCARLVCVSVAIDDGPITVLGPTDDETDTLGAFEAYLRDHKAGKADWVGCHLKGLDIHLLKRRAARHRFDALARAIPWRRYSKRLIDIAEVWVAPRPGTYVTQDAICEALGLPVRPADEIDGAEIPKAWAEKNTDAIVRHARGDIERLRAAFRRLEACGFLEAL